MSRRKKSAPTSDNGIGVISYRGWLYSGQRSGHTFGAIPDGEIIHCKPTPPHALSHPVHDDGKPDLQQELARLTKDERAVYELRTGLYEPEMVRISAVPVGELVAMERRGYTVIEKTKRHERQHNGMSVEVWDVEGKDWGKQGLDHDEIAERLKLTRRQVRSLVESANRKLRGAR